MVFVLKLFTAIFLTANAGEALFGGTDMALGLVSAILAGANLYSCACDMSGF